MPGPDPDFSAKEVRQAIRESGGVVAQAARILDCHPSTVYKYARKYTTVQTTLEEARLNHAAKAEAYHARLVEDRDHPDHYKALMDVLRNYHPDNWSDERQEKEHSGSLDIDVDFSSLTDKQIERLADGEPPEEVL